MEGGTVNVAETLKVSDDGDGILNVTGGLMVCDTLRCTDGGDGVVNIDGGTIQACHVRADDGGLINLISGLLEVTCEGSISCGGGAINITGGTLIMAGDQCENIPSCVTAYYVDIGGGCAGSRGTLNCDYDPIEDKTTITANPPNYYKAWSPSPVDGAVWQSVEVILTWCPGDCLLRHAVYLGTDPVAVANADTGDPEFMGYKNPGQESYDPTGLVLWTTYYWRIDEYHRKTLPGCSEAPIQTVGDVWSFTTGCDLIDGDINLDCVVNFFDYAMLADDWTECVFFPDDVTP
jgi:hypothetical protein